MRNLAYRKTLIHFVFFFVSINCFAVAMHDDGSVLYQEALTAYESKNYGKSLKYSEDAILARKQHITYEIGILNTALQPHQVQKAGNRITDILNVLNERDEYEAINIINLYLKKKGDDFFGNTISNLLSYLDSIKVYPEAQKLIGDIYKIEGEYDFAEEYYLEALKNADVLDIHDQRYEILYLLADISGLKNDDEKREVRLLSILNEDERNFKNEAFVASMLRTIRSEKGDSKKKSSSKNGDSLEKFFNMYRSDGFYTLKAYHELAVYYFEKDNMDKALGFAALDTITCFSKITDVVKKRNINFEYDGLKSVLFEASHYDDIIRWGRDNDVWSCFNFLAEVAKKDGCIEFASNLLKVSASYLPDEYYQKQAAVLLGGF